MSVITEANNSKILEYRIPEILLNPKTENQASIIQFRIPITESTTVDTAIQQVIEEAKVATGLIAISEESMNQLREDTKGYLETYLSK